MNYSKINTHDIANGPGVRVSLFVSGCRRHCKGCFNPETWNFYNGEIFGWETVEEIVKAADRDFIAGLTILGGEPLEPENDLYVLALCIEFKRQYPDKTIWLYTGYSWEEIHHRPIMDCVDVVVDGPFMEDQRDLRLKYCGSSNQRIIDVKRSRATGKIIVL